jgi:ubiquinol-cytochrome c reductase cytochrome c subunit
MTRVLFAALVLVALTQTPATNAQSQETSAQQSAVPPGNAEEGRKLFASYGCYQCHGREAQGSSATGPRLGPRPIAFTAFSRYVRRPTGQMPPYTTRVVSDADMAHIYAFVQARPAPAAVQSIPLLREP